MLSEGRGNESVVSAQFLLTAPGEYWPCAPGPDLVSVSSVTKQKHSSTEMKFSSENLDILLRKDQ